MLSTATKRPTPPHMTRRCCRAPYCSDTRKAWSVRGPSSEPVVTMSCFWRCPGTPLQACSQSCWPFPRQGRPDRARCVHRRRRPQPNRMSRWAAPVPQRRRLHHRRLPRHQVPCTGIRVRWLRPASQRTRKPIHPARAIKGRRPMEAVRPGPQHREAGQVQKSRLEKGERAPLEVRQALGSRTGARQESPSSPPLEYITKENPRTHPSACTAPSEKGFFYRPNGLAITCGRRSRPSGSSPCYVAFAKAFPFASWNASRRTVPAVPSTSTSSPSWRAAMTPLMPTTHGLPYSRATSAPC